MRRFFKSAGEASRPPLPEVPFPESSFEQEYKSYSVARGFVSKHTRDVLLLALALGSAVSAAAIYFGGLFVPGLGDDDSKLQLVASLVAAVLGGLGSIFVILYQTSKRRLATVDIFGMEMLTIIRLFVLTRFVAKLHDLYEANGPKGAVSANSVEVFRADASAAFLDHNLAGTFSNNAESLGALSSDIVDYTVAFYTFLNAIKEHTEALLKYIERMDGAGGAQLNARIVNSYIWIIVYFTDVLAIVGFRALDSLIEKDRHNAYARQLCLLLGRESNLFLMEMIDTEERRNEEKAPLVRSQNTFWLREIRRFLRRRRRP